MTLKNVQNALQATAIQAQIKELDEHLAWAGATREKLLVQLAQLQGAPVVVPDATPAPKSAGKGKSKVADNGAAYTTPVTTSVPLPTGNDPASILAREEARKAKQREQGRLYRERKKAKAAAAKAAAEQAATLGIVAQTGPVPVAPAAVPVDVADVLAKEEARKAKQREQGRKYRERRKAKAKAAKIVVAKS